MGPYPVGHEFDRWEDRDLTYRLIQGEHGRVRMESQQTKLLAVSGLWGSSAWVPMAVALRITTLKSFL